MYCRGTKSKEREVSKLFRCYSRLQVDMISEEYENLNNLIGKFIKLSPEFPEEESLAVQIGTSIGKIHGLISDLIEENRKLKKND